MAVVGSNARYHIRTTNKEPEWSNICNNVFDQYLEGDDPFDFGHDRRERSSSDDSGNLFDFSGSSEQSHQTSATSPNPSLGEEVRVQGVKTAEAKQPKAKAPGDFWTKKLRALEQNAAECEKRQQKLRSTKSHPDFLSLGGYPSPPALPPSPTGQSHSAQRRTSRAIAANGSKTPTQRSVTNVRSVSRGRPVGVSKPPASAAVNPYATIRKTNASPSKMMNPSRYRAGFKDVWAERTQRSPKKFELNLTSPQTFPDSPPPSARSTQGHFAAFGSPWAYPSAVPGCDDQISPLASTFQHSARIHTPIASPLLSPSGGHAQLSYFDAGPALPSNPYATSQPVLLNDTAPLCTDDASLVANRIQSFDFGFSSSPVEDTWSAAAFSEPSTAQSISGRFPNGDPFADLRDNDFGLGISCDPNLVSNYTTMADTSIMPSMTSHSPEMPSESPFYVPSLPNGLPSLPTRQAHGSFPVTPRRRVSRSPSPPATESRSRRASASRRASRHRRTKSTNSTPRHPQGGEKGGGFVNFTPSDSNKILSGVAPSGSSKTKARREKEAADKRRRLSQAAMRAVVEAGGDVEALQKAGLLGAES